MPKCKHGGFMKCKSIKDLDAFYFANAFYLSQNKPQQDSFILKYCLINKPERVTGKKKISVKYHVRKKNGQLVQVCQRSFCGILNESKERVKRLCKYHFIHPEAPIRGGDRKKILYMTKKNGVIDFIKKLKTIEVHYCRDRIAQRQYLPSELSINKLYQMYTSSQTESNLIVKSSYFRNVFNSSFNIGFKGLSTDMCSIHMYSIKRKIKK